MIRTTTYTMLTVSLLTVSIFVSAQQQPKQPSLLPPSRWGTPFIMPKSRIGTVPALPRKSGVTLEIPPVDVQPYTFRRTLTPGMQAMQPDHMPCWVPDKVVVQNMPVQFISPFEITDAMPNAIAPQRY